MLGRIGKQTFTLMCLLGAITLMACGEDPSQTPTDLPLTVSFETGVNYQVPPPQDPKATWLTLCKVGPDATFSIDPTSPNLPLELHTVANGTCEDVFNPTIIAPHTIDVTEHVPGGSTLDSIQVYSVDVINNFADTIFFQEPTIFGTNMVEAHVGVWKAGCLLVFYNSEDSTGGDGCTPGYYKNLKKHGFAWTDAGYDPDQTVVSVFSEAGNAPYAHLGAATMHQGLSFKGGNTVAEKAEILLRAAVAAVLNADNPNVEFSLTSAQIVADVNAALAAGDADAILNLAGDLDAENNAGCPLNNGK